MEFIHSFLVEDFCHTFEPIFLKQVLTFFLFQFQNSSTQSLLSAHKEMIAFTLSLSLCIYLSVSLSLCLSVSLSLCLSVSLSLSLSRSLGICLSVSLSISVSLYLSLCLSLFMSLLFRILFFCLRLR